MLNGESKLVARPLTDLQREALHMVARGGLKVIECVGYRGTHYMQIITPHRTQIAGQVSALIKRRFVRWGQNGPELTVAGAFELYFNARKMLQRA